MMFHVDSPLCCFSETAYCLSEAEKEATAAITTLLVLYRSKRTVTREREAVLLFRRREASGTLKLLLRRE